MSIRYKGVALATGPNKQLAAGAGLQIESGIVIDEYRPNWPRRLEISDAKKRCEAIHDSETTEPLEFGPGCHTLCRSYFHLVLKALSPRVGIIYPLVVIQEAGVDGFWLGALSARKPGSRAIS